MMTKDEVIGFAKSSALAAIDCAAEYDDSVAAYRENIRDTLNEHSCPEHEEAAFAVYDAEITRLSK